MKNHNAFLMQGRLTAFQIKETFLVLVTAITIPFLIHLVPSYDNVPWGARLLPMFYAPFVAIVFFRPHVGFTSALISPIINVLLTGNPQLDRIAVFTMELTVFTCISYFIYERLPHFLANASISYLLAKMISWLLFLIIAKPTPASSFASLLFTFKAASLGIAILTLINILVFKLRDSLS